MFSRVSSSGEAWSAENSRKPEKVELKIKKEEGRGRGDVCCASASWFRVGVVVDRTKALGSKFDIGRGPLVGFKYKKVDFTTYWLSPGSKEATFVFTVALNF